MAIQYIQPGKPNQNAFIERFNRTFREKLLDRYLFARLEDLREAADWWMIEYNEHREHDSLGDLRPANIVNDSREVLLLECPFDGEAYVPSDYAGATRAHFKEQQESFGSNCLAKALPGEPLFVTSRTDAHPSARLLLKPANLMSADERQSRINEISLLVEDSGLRRAAGFLGCFTSFP